MLVGVIVREIYVYRVGISHKAGARWGLFSTFIALDSSVLAGSSVARKSEFEFVSMNTGKR
jgi:hypothetical protein